MQNPPKAIKRELRILCGLAYEREMSRALTKLHEQFALWKNDELDCWDLSQLIHEFHDGESRDLYQLYVNNNMYELTICRALIREELLTNEDLSEEIKEYLEPHINTYQEISESYEAED